MATIIFRFLCICSATFIVLVFPAVAAEPVKVAFIGDQKTGSNPEAVLQVIKQEGAQLVVHSGDFDYSNNPDVWDAMITKVLGDAFPYIISVGNHDTSAWVRYQQKMITRVGKVPGLTCTGDFGVQSVCGFKGLTFILSGVGTLGSNHEQYIRAQLSSANTPWKICSWHKNQNALQTGTKGDEVGWGPYEACREGGAIIATAHEHSYERTKTLINTQTQTVDPSCSDPNRLCVGPGRTFVFVSGLGGNSIRNQDRCLPATYPYGCNGLWAKIYTSDQSAKYGALFIVFNTGGNTSLAHGYFKNIAGEIVDEFDVSLSGQPPPATTPSTQTPAPTTQAQPTPTSAVAPTPQPTQAPTQSPNAFSLTAPGARDQDDMAIWIHPTDTTKSLIITSDKYARKLFIYDLTGAAVQTITPPGMTGNIDVRYGFPLSGGVIDIAVTNDRTNGKLLVYKINIASGTLIQIDNGAIATQATVPNYGLGLYKSPVSGKYYAIVTQNGGGNIGQYELTDDGNGKVKGTLARSWKVGGQSEGVVVDDENKTIFIGEEKTGIWKLGAEPTDPSPGSIAVSKGTALKSDIEGLTLYHGAGNTGYLIASSQGASQFVFYDRTTLSQRYVHKITGVGSTDGIDVTNVNLGGTFATGMFVVHNGSQATTLKAIPWSSIASAGNLTVSTNWNPRGGNPTTPTAGQPTPAPTINAPSATPATNAPAHSPQPTQPPQVTPMPVAAQNLIIFPSRDSYVDEKKRNKNFGKSQKLLIDRKPKRIAFLTFALPNLAGRTIKKTQLVLHKTGSSKGKPVVKLKRNVSWNEKDITFSKQPKLKKKVQTIRTASAGDTISLDLTKRMKSMKNGTVTLAVEARGDDQITIYSKEAKDSLRPTLLITLESSGTASNSTPPSSDPSPASVSHVPSPTGTANTPTHAPTQIVTPTAGGPTPLPPPVGAVTGIWTSPSELANKPMSGSAWTNVKSAADASWGSADLSNQDSHHPQYVLAGALVYARTGQNQYRDKVISGLQSIVGTEANARSLALGRNLAPYAVAADLIGFQDAGFKSYLSGIRTRVNSEGRSLVACHEVRPNNWGTMCGASRIAIDLYIGDRTDLDRAARVFKGYVGDRSSYANFNFQPGALTWMCDPSQPRPVNPVGCIKNGHDLSGAPVDDVQRGGAYTWPPNATNYAWGGFAAAVAQAELLHRAGYPAYEWEGQAVRRGMKFISDSMASSSGNPTDWMPWIVNLRYGTTFPTKTPTGWGRLMAWTDWTHAGGSSSVSSAPASTTAP